jgi:hypothetical protein
MPQVLTVCRSGDSGGAGELVRANGGHVLWHRYTAGHALRSDGFGKQPVSRRALTDFNVAVQVRGQLASDVSTFYYAASHLTNGTLGWQLQSRVVESDLLTLAQECQGI